MSFDAYVWVKVGHIAGFTLWIAGLVATLQLLRAYAATGADQNEQVRAGLTSIARPTAILMDLGATLAMVFGLLLALKSPMYPNTAFKSGGWLHVKLTLVVLALLSMHGMARGKLKKLRQGQPAAVPPWMLIVVLVAAAAIITLGGNPLILRK